MASQELIESRIDKDRSSEIGLTFGSGLDMKNLVQAMEIAKAMSISGPCVPSYLRNNPGSCLFIIMRAARWGVDPFALAEKSYEVENKGEKRIAFESQVFRAVAESLAPIKGRMQHRYEGDGEDRICIVWATLKGEDVPREHKSPTLGKRRPAKNDYGKTKGSPLWDSKPDVQLLYDTQRDWVRINCPDVLMGIYTRDELEEAGFEVVGHAASDLGEAAIPAQEALHHRLSIKAAAAAGFDPKGVAATMAEISGGAAEPASAKTDPVGFAPNGQAAAQTEEACVTPHPPAERGSPALSTAAAADDPHGGEAPVLRKPEERTDTEAPHSATASVSADDSAGGSASVSAQWSDHTSASKPAAPAQTSGAAGEVDDGLDDNLPQPAEYVKPDLPKDGRDYPAYVRAILADPGLDAESSIRIWWESAGQKRFRNGLVNLTPELAKEAKEIVIARLSELKSQ